MMLPMKTRVKRTRSIFTSGKVKLGTKVHRAKKGPGSYRRKRTPAWYYTDHLMGQ